MVRLHAVVATLALAGLAACMPEDAGPMPDFEWEGAWITVLGYETTPADTCAGTFDYLDDYAGALASEFGVSAPLGDYRWYSKALFAELDPCGDPDKSCTGRNGVFTDVMPTEHELVHLVNGQTTQCPLFLAEGLAEYYGTTSSTPASLDLSELLADPGATSFSSSNYPLAGAFVAYLIEDHGLDALLEVCERSGVEPTPVEFDEAVETTLGVSVDLLAQEFASFECSYPQYRSKQYECGLEPSVEVGDQPVELILTLDCADSRTIGPSANEIWTLDVVRILEAGTYLVTLEDEAGDIVDGDVGLQLVPCMTCKDQPLLHTFEPGLGPVLSPVQLDASDYIVRIWGEPGVSKQMTLRFTV